MITLSIKSSYSPITTNGRDYLRKEFIIERQLKKCPVKEGDWVKWKTSKGDKTGQVVQLLTNIDAMEWRGGTQPFFIEVKSPMQQVIDGVVVNYGHEISHIPLKKVRSFP